VFRFGFRNQPPLPRQRATSISAGVTRLLQPGRFGVEAGFGTMNDQPITIGERLGWGEPQPFGIAAVDERQHIYIIGKTGSGKTTLLRNLILQHIALGHGVGVIDPHGDLAEELLNHIPPKRADHLVYFNPGDIEFPIGLNLLANVAPDNRHLVASGIVGAFKGIWRDSWGPRLEYILYNAVSALLDCRNATLLGVNRMLTDDKFLAKVTRQIKDPFIRAFWAEEYAGYDERFKREAIAPIQNKVGAFLTDPLLNRILTRERSDFDLRRVMDEEKILLVNLAKGKIGVDASALLGALLVSKIGLAGLSRADIKEERRRDFYLYLDEFQNLATLSLANMLSELRKYRVNMILSHQYLSQLDPQVRDAILGNTGTIISFRLGLTDAEILAGEFYPFFSAKDLINLPNYHIYLKLMIDGVVSQPFSGATVTPE